MSDVADTRGITHAIEEELINVTGGHLNRAFRVGVKALSSMHGGQHVEKVRKEVIVLRVMKHIIDAQLNHLRLHKLK